MLVAACNTQRATCVVCCADRFGENSFAAVFNSSFRFPFCGCRSEVGRGKCCTSNKKKEHEAGSSSGALSPKATNQFLREANLDYHL